jgi:hypothetical protein
MTAKKEQAKAAKAENNEAAEEEKPLTGLTQEELKEKLRKNDRSDEEPETLQGMLGVGEPYPFGKLILYIPALKINQLTRALRLIDEISRLDIEDPEQNERAVNKMMEVIHMAVVRNYPEMTIDELSELVDLGNIRDIFGMVLAGSNIIAKNA